VTGLPKTGLCPECGLTIVYANPAHREWAESIFRAAVILLVLLTGFQLSAGSIFRMLQIHPRMQQVFVIAAIPIAATATLAAWLIQGRVADHKPTILAWLGIVVVFLAILRLTVA
jgi:hypothetical protein